MAIGRLSKPSFLASQELRYLKDTTRLPISAVSTLETNLTLILIHFSREDRTRTGDPLLPKQVRYQLRYFPMSSDKAGANTSTRASAGLSKSHRLSSKTDDPLEKNPS